MFQSLRLPPRGIDIAQGKGKYLMQHRGCSILKGADDMVIFHELFWRLRPATVIELGTFTGGSAVWMADMLRLMEVDSTIYSMDIELSNLEERVKEIKPSNVHFFEGNSYEIEKTFTSEMLQSLPHPWLVIEDAHTNINGIMNHFGSYMKTGDYFIIKDVHPNLPRDIGKDGSIYGDDFETIGPSAIIEMKKFLSQHANEYAVDSFYTDFFGYNGTWNMHGYIRKM
ncbi:rhamnosyl O-methyltransferase-like [Halichondria panicea]|uniref:rhamnosyl O-methyltransferase-like n=1 Tax=Halichondria panicea TaxID=6063 RepID=UPI00312B520A